MIRRRQLLALRALEGRGRYGRYLVLHRLLLLGLLLILLLFLQHLELVPVGLHLRLLDEVKQVDLHRVA